MGASSGRWEPAPGPPVIEISDTAPRVDVQTAEYVRLLGYPPGWVLAERASELAAWARDWYVAVLFLG